MPPHILQLPCFAGAHHVFDRQSNPGWRMGETCSSCGQEQNLVPTINTTRNRAATMAVTYASEDQTQWTPVRPSPWPSFKFHSDASYQEEPCSVSCCEVIVAEDDVVLCLGIAGGCITSASGYVC